MGATASPQWTPSQRRLLAIVVLGGGTVVLSDLRKRIRRWQKLQKQLADACASEQGSGGSISLASRRRPKIAVDAVFMRRLAAILGVCIPSPTSREGLFVVLQTALLVCRTLLTDRIAGLEGRCGRTIVSQNWAGFINTTKAFAITCIPASIVNSGLKCMQSIIALAFRRRLTEQLHKQYFANRAYYVASTLGGLSNADQRITEDVEKFCDAISELYSYTFKPLLDVILFTRSLSRLMGYRGQFALYGYFFLCSLVLRSISPPLALMTAQEAQLSGSFRSAHQRIVSNAEEIAYNDPPGGDTERLILNRQLNRLLKHSRLTAFQKFVQQVADGYLVKYAASCVGLCVYALPLYLNPKQGTTEELTGDYIRAMRLMMNTSSAIGQLVLVYKRVTALAGYTSRVSELVESVKQLSTIEGQKQTLALKNIASAENLAAAAAAMDSAAPHAEFLDGDCIKFERVTLYSPEGTLLVRELTFGVLPGQSVMITGPNGSGKSSLFRVLAELWPLPCGRITRPPREQMFYLSQRPYLVSGSLRDQLLYPKVPRSVAKEMSSRELAPPGKGEGGSGGAGLGARGAGGALEDGKEDEVLRRCLEQTEIAYLLDRGQGWDTVSNWADVLSGGEKQRLAVARLLYHAPRFAVLDECTSAVSADGEEKLYQRMLEAGITLLSIGHRPTLRKYHAAVLHFDGSSKGYGWSFEVLPK